MDAVDIWRRVLVGAIVALLVAVGIGGVYLWYAWSKVGSGSALNDIPLTPQQEQRKALDPFTAPAPVGSVSAQGSTADTPPSPPSPETPSEFSAPPQSASAEVPRQEEVSATPSSFDAPL